MDFSNNHKWVDIQCDRKDRAKPFCQTDKIGTFEFEKVSLNVFVRNTYSIICGNTHEY